VPVHALIRQPPQLEGRAASGDSGAQALLPFPLHSSSHCATDRKRRAPSAPGFAESAAARACAPSGPIFWESRLSASSVAWPPSASASGPTPDPAAVPPVGEPEDLERRARLHARAERHGVGALKEVVREVDGCERGARLQYLAEVLHRGAALVVHAQLVLRQVDNGEARAAADRVRQRARSRYADRVVTRVELELRFAPLHTTRELDRVLGWC